MKHIKMVLYGEPGVGKSVFACNAPRPFFITTDGNYEFLEEFGAKAENHKQVYTWAEAKKVFAMNFDEYDTIVIDLTEDLFKWCEYEYCKHNGYDHVSDIGYGKGYDITRNEFFIQIAKILGLEKNVILIMHGISSTVKDRRGVEHTKYYPTNRIPDKVLDMIEGRVRYFLRAYLRSEEIDGKIVKKRYLSIVPKENEYGILRGINENDIPSDIPLDFNTFANVIGLEIDKKPAKQAKKAEPKVEQKVITDIKLQPKDNNVVEKKVEEKHVEEKAPVVEEKPVEEKVEKVEEPVKEEPTEEHTEEKKVLTKEEKIAAIKAKMAAMKARK